VTTATTATTATTTASTSTAHKKGDISGSGEPNIGGVLEILKHLAGMKSALDNPASYEAACIVDHKPVIGDVLEILKFLAGMNSALDIYWK
jgi:hypothetical protein